MPNTDTLKTARFFCLAVPFTMCIVNCVKMILYNLPLFQF